MLSMPKVECPFELATAEFEVLLFERGLAEEPANLELVEALAFAYTNCGRYADGLALDLELCRALPKNPLCFYNKACSYSLIGDAQSAADALIAALRLGYHEYQHMLEDEDLAFLRSHPAFTAVKNEIARRSGV